MSRGPRIDWSRADFSRPPQDLAREMGCTLTAVYNARKRAAGSPARPGLLDAAPPEPAQAAPSAPSAPPEPAPPPMRTENPAQARAVGAGQERAELHRTIWGIANDLRGSVDGWDFKNYVLTALFYRFISENLAAYADGLAAEAGVDADYRNMSDDDAEVARETLVETKGFFIPPSLLFANVLERAPRDPDLNETLEKVFRHIEASAEGTPSEDSLRGLFEDFDVNSNKLGPTVSERNRRLERLLRGVADMALGSIRENGIDAFGDAYEYLMGMYAANGGKSGGEFYTPQEVSELLARLAAAGRTTVSRVYDPACGSGSLLLKFARLRAGENVEYFGQEINLTTYNLCRINMFLHDVNFSRFHIAQGDTLTDPECWNGEQFDAIVSNPPYSIKWEGDANPVLIGDPRFAPAGVLAPRSKADLAFILHALDRLADDGCAAIVCFPGILYRGGAERQIRRHLVEGGHVDCVIQLPGNLFFGTSIATCIMVLRKRRTDTTTLFVDASAQCVKVTNANRLTEDNIAWIVRIVAERKDVPHAARVVSQEDIAAQDHNLSVSAYVEQEDTREKIDIAALNAELREIVARENALRAEIDRIVAEIEGQED